MKKQYFLGLIVVVLLTLFNVSPVLAHDGVEHVSAAQAVVHQMTPRVGFLESLKTFFSFRKDSVTANVITSTQTSKTITAEQKVNEQEIRQLTAKLNSIDASIRAQTTVLESSILNKLVPNKIVSKNTIGKAIEDKNNLLAKLAEKSPKDAIAFIEKNKLVGKKQVVGTPVTKISKKDITVDINHFDYDKSDKADYFGTYVDGRVVRTVFSEQFRGLGGQYKIAELSGYQFGNNILITQMSGFEQVVQQDTHIQQRSADSPDYKVLVLLVDYLDSDPPQQLTDAQTTHDILFNGDLHNFFYEQSYGKMNMIGDVYGWYRLHANAEGLVCNPLKATNDGNDSIFNNPELMSYIVADNIQVTSYDHVMIIANCKNITGGGFAGKFTYGNVNESFPGWQQIGFTYFGQGVSLAVVRTSNGHANLHTMAHEVGHKLYNGPSNSQYYTHANAYDCGDQVLSVSSNCLNIEYGNYFDAMGSWQAFSNHFRAGLKDALGWFNSDQILTITESSGQEDVYALAPLERIGGFNNNVGDYKMAKLKPPYMNYAPYLLEYRQSVGYDSNISGSLLASNTDGIFIYKNSGTTPSMIQQAILLDMNPQITQWDQDVQNVTLNIGRTYVDEDLGITIETINANPQHVFFTVRYTGYAPCQDLPISLTLVQQFWQDLTQSGEVRYSGTVKIMNVDHPSVSCNGPLESLTFDVLPDAPLIATFDSTPVTPLPGSYELKSVSIIVPIGTPSGTYVTTILVTDMTSGEISTYDIPITVN